MYLYLSHIGRVQRLIVLATPICERRNSFFPFVCCMVSYIIIPKFDPPNSTEASVCVVLHLNILHSLKIVHNLRHIFDVYSVCASWEASAFIHKHN